MPLATIWQHDTDSYLVGTLYLSWEPRQIALWFYIDFSPARLNHVHM